MNRRWIGPCFNAFAVKSATVAVCVFCVLAAPLLALAEPQQQPPGDVANIAPSSFEDVALTNMRGSIGLAFGTLESYSDFKAGNGSKQISRLTSVQPSVLLRERREKSDLSLVYTFGFGTYTGAQRVSTASHLATLDFSHRLSPRTLIQFTHRLSSAVNDYGTTFTPGPLTNGPSTFVQDVDVSRQRITQNSLAATVNYQMSSRGSLSVFGGYDDWRFGGSEITDTHRFHIGVRSQQRINKWLSLDNSYSTAINKVTEGQAAAKIHRLQVGGLTFHPTRTIEIAVGGGGEVTTYQNRREFGATAQAGISKKSKSTLLYLGYNRGFSGAVGTTDIFTADNVIVSYTQWLSQRINFKLSSRYTVGASQTGSLDYTISSAELGIALTRHSLVSIDYSYVSQELSNVNIGSPRSNRYWARAGFQYFLPSIAIH